MYKYLYGVGRYKNQEPGLHVVDISQYYVKDLSKLFNILYIVIEDQIFSKKIAIALEDYQLAFSKDNTSNIQQWLDLNPTLKLKTQPFVPGDTKNHVKVERLFVNGYFHHPGDINLAKDRQDGLFPDMAPDIRIAHYKYVSGIDYSKQVDYSLFTCNGVLYRAVGRSDGIYLLGAGSDYIYAKQDVRVGALNFQKIGKVNTIPITDSMVTDVEANGPKSWKINLKDVDVKNKTLWLVVNGMLMTDQEMFYQVGENEMMFKPYAFDVMTHFHVFSKYTRTPKLTNMMKMDTYKRQALTSHNSFLVTIDNPTLGIEVEPLTTFTYPNVLHTEVRFEHPLVLENGLMPVPYPKSYGIGQRLLNHDVRVLNKYPIQSAGTLAGNDYNALFINEGDPGWLPRGYFFKIHALNFTKA